MRILIKNGSIIDGSGAEAFKADILIVDDTIAEVAENINTEADKVIDAAGKTVVPGFIDVHSHADVSLPIFPTADSLLMQGVTTVVPGNCGLSPAPLSDFSRDEFMASMNDGDGPKLPDNEWSTFGEYLDYLEKIGISPNVLPLVGQGAIRAAVMGFSAARPTEDQLEAMQQLASETMDQGAVGISTGLIYPPGSFAATDELVEVTKPIAEKGGIYFSHIRGESDTLLEAIAEAIDIGRRANLPVQISHFKAAGRDNWHKATAGLKLIDDAIAEGLDVTSDMYPYVAGATGLVSMLPEWAQEGGSEDIFKRLSDPETRVKMVESMKREGFFKITEWDQVLIADASNKDYAGYTVAELAEKYGKDPYEFVFDSLLETKLQMGMVIFMMDEENVKMQLTHPAMMIGTDAAGLPFDGPYATGIAHPRSFGTYPRVLGKYVREDGVLPLNTAIYKMTGLPAKRMGLTDRGLIKAGAKADVVVFDPETIIDTCDFKTSFKKPIGIDYVLVNGTVVVDHNTHTQERPGRVLRS